MTELLRIGDRVFRPITSDLEPPKKTIRSMIKAKYGTQAAAAEAWGITRQAVSHFVLGQRKVPDFVKKDLGL